MARFDFNMYNLKRKLVQVKHINHLETMESAIAMARTYFENEVFAHIGTIEVYQMLPRETISPEFMTIYPKRKGMPS